MFKKIVVGAVAVAAIGLLVAGAMNRTNVKFGGSETAGGRGRAATSESGQFGAQSLTPAAAVESSTVQGVVAGIDTAKLVLTMADGTTMELGGQPWRYAQTTGFAAAVGDTVAVTGFQDGDHFEATRLTHAASNVTTILRGDDGSPRWSGRGRTN